MARPSDDAVTLTPESEFKPARPTDPSTKCLWKYMEVNKRYSRCVEAVQHAINSGMVGQPDKLKDLLEKRNNVNWECSSVAKELFEFSTIEVYDKKEIEALINFKSIFYSEKENEVRVRIILPIDDEKVGYKHTMLRNLAIYNGISVPEVVCSPLRFETRPEMEDEE